MKIRRIDKKAKGAQVRRTTITDMLDRMANEFCSDYCKWPEKYTGEDGVERSCRLYEERCGKCPLNWIR